MARKTEAKTCDCGGPECKCGSKACCGGLFAGLLTGAIAGGAVALLFTPLKGEEIRQKGKERAPELWERRGTLVEEARMKSAPAVDRALGVVEGLRRRVVSVYSEIRLRMREAVEEGREGIVEGEEEARGRYLLMTKRHQHRRR